MAGKSPRRARGKAGKSAPVKTIIEYGYKGYDIVSAIGRPTRVKGRFVPRQHLYEAVRNNKVEHTAKRLDELKKWIDETEKPISPPAPPPVQKPEVEAPMFVRVDKANITDSKAMWELLKCLGSLPKHNFKMLIRRDGFRLVGVVTSKKPELDTELGESRVWAWGNRPDGRVFKEPLDRKNPMLKRLEDVVLVETQHFIITARRSPDLGDEDQNFMYLDNPLRVGDIYKLERDLETKTRTIASVKLELENSKKLEKYWRDAANSLGNAQRETEQRISILSKDNNMLIQRVRHLENLAEMSEVHGITVRSMLDKLIKDARAKGIELEESDVERAINAVNALVKLKEGAGPLTPRPQTSEEQVKLKIELEQAHRRIEALEAGAGLKKGEKPAVTTG